MGHFAYRPLAACCWPSKKGEDSFEGGSTFSDLTDISHIEKTIQELKLIYDVVYKLRPELETRV